MPAEPRTGASAAPPNPVGSDGIPEIPPNEISADQVTMHRAYTEHLPHYGFVKPCSPQEEIDLSPNRLNPGFIADEIEFGRARTQPISLFEHRRWKVHHNLNKKDKFFRGHDERLHDGGGSATKYFRTKRHWYLYIRRLVTIYFVPLQLGVITGLLWANIDYDNYVYVWGTDDDESVDLGFSIAHHPVTLHFILNDIFMAFFFGIAMVEIVLALLPGGALSPVAKAIVPLLCTLGGILGPIGVFFSLMYIQKAAGAFDDSQFEFSELLEGWGVVVATDISIAWLIATIVFGSAHTAIRFLLVLAVADDVGGMLIIAFFYPSEHESNQWYLFMCVGACLVALLLRIFKFRHWLWYIALAGPLAWYGLLASGVHASLALCLVVPFMPKYILIDQPPQDASEPTTATLPDPNPVTVEAPQRQQQTVVDGKRVIEGPLEHFDHDCSFFVHCGLFFFALANAGVQFTEDAFGWITFNVVVSLIFGKCIGIFTFGSIALLIPNLSLPHGMGHLHLFIVGVVSGVGLTVALVVAHAAYSQRELLDQAKLGALLSLLAGPIAIALGIVLKIDKVSAPPPSGPPASV
ncbi:hypothetical protein FOZ61_010414 [Perkinsus olseni]|uniref:Uncharacterized protein n=1 Tax=Perkinsus olseni TaxID=32597 RepID=A0A7J6KVZ5_PEROL|nr:hypothetical protein FOZ61_010414 [Perkinsus olseni]KAF4653125.1 hypothetical protein FOL46_009355 [Perkinsus olseni]